ncbi:MAG: HAMP domain-containing histidine kinase [Mediterranea sp.]|jgi:signal transduction histidine kinase|nr:HAMP domain-containing histidine kinase [Mediterranea sp.]
MIPFHVALRSFYITEYIGKNQLIILSFVIIILLLIAIVIYMHKSKQKAAASLKKVQELSEESSRLQNAFIANMTHELRTPLNAIIGFTNILAETDTLSHDERILLLQEINMNRNFLVQMIDDLLDYSKLETNTLEFQDEEIDVNAVMSDLCGLINSQPRQSGIQVEFTERIARCRLRIDKKRFLQVLKNLLDNALKYTDNGGVQMGYRRAADGRLYFYVADTGCGMDEEGRKRIFDRFVKMNYNIRGTGLGLAITKAIVEHYGGSIGVESKKGEGSTFYFTLPAKVEYREYGKF